MAPSPTTAQEPGRSECTNVTGRNHRDSVWLTQDQMAELFGRERSVITRHIGNVFKEGELNQEATRAKYAHVRSEGTRSVTRAVDYYNLDVIISVGYRVKSQLGTQFRIWATRTLRDHLVRGYTLDHQRFEKNASELEAPAPITRSGVDSSSPRSLLVAGDGVSLEE